MGWPQLVFIAWCAVTLGAALALHGQTKSYRVSALGKLFRIACMGGLLWAGGFFTPAHAQVPPDALRYRADLVRSARSVWGMDAPVATFAAQVHQESAWKPGAVSPVGAAGLAQFMPGTSLWIAGKDAALVANQPINPAWALRALVTYDKYLYDLAPQRYGPHDRMWVALRGYNGGLGHWQKEAASTGLAQPTRAQVDAACGHARRAALHCPENLGYPRRIFSLQPRYATWGPGL